MTRALGELDTIVLNLEERVTQLEGKAKPTVYSVEKGHLSLLNGWAESTVPDPKEPVRILLYHDGRVRFRGALDASGCSSSRVLQLPKELRPMYTVTTPVNRNLDIAENLNYIAVDEDGGVDIDITNKPTRIDLDNLSYELGEGKL